MADIDFLEMILRSTGAFLVLLVMTRIMGRTQLSQITYFNYVTGITIGSIAADIAGESDTSFGNGLVSLIWWSLLTIVVGYISLFFVKLRIVVDGQPTIIIKDGILLEKAMRNIRLNLDDLSMMLRDKGVFSIKEVDYAILEPNGKLSVLKKQEQQAPTRKDMNIPSPPLKFIPSEIISDGRIVKRNLTELGLNRKWLDKELSGTKLEQVYYAEIQSDGSLYYQKKSSND